jgi:hypothetical protein
VTHRQNWVDSLVTECSHVETPSSWLWWSFISCISAAAGNNYYLTTLKGDLIYRPNLYIMLLGESGLGKGFPVNRAAMLVTKADVTRVIKGRSSIQAIVKELSTTKSKEGKSPITDSRGYIVNGELSTAIIQDPDSLTILTDLFDGHYNPEWTNLLKGDGAEKLKNPYITALFGSSPAHFYDSIPQANIEGGYIGRNLIIYEEKRSREVDLLDSNSDEVMSDKDKFDEYIAPTYVPHLTKIASLKGQLKPTDDARQLFNTWRRKWRAAQSSDKTGFLNRVPDHVLKVSMCLSLADYEFNGEIDEIHMQTSIDKVTSLVYANKRTTEGRGPDPQAAATKLVLDFLLASKDQELTKKQLLWKGYGTYNTFTLDQIIENLLEMGWITKLKVGAGSNLDWLIRLAGEPLENYKKYIQERKKNNVQFEGS